MFHETQFPPWWVYLVLAWSGLILPVILFFIGRHQRRQGRGVGAVIVQLAAVLSLLLSIGVFVCFGKMSTEVNAGEVRVTFGFVSVYSDTVSAANIEKAAAVTYQPGDYGGWGIRGADNDRVLSMSGDRGVRLHLKDDKLLLIGSEQADALAAAVTQLLTGK